MTTPCPAVLTHSTLACTQPAGHPHAHTYQSTSGVAGCAKEEA